MISKTFKPILNYNKSYHLLNTAWGVEERAQSLKTLAAFAEGLSSVPSMCAHQVTHRNL